MSNNQFASNIHSRILKTLRDCDLIHNERQLRAVFADPRLQLWQGFLPVGSENLVTLLEETVAMLIKRSNKAGERATVLFLLVLQERVDPDDWCYTQVETLLDELRLETTITDLVSVEEGQSLIFLFETLRTRFNLNELHELCIYLHINFEELPGDSLSHKALELVTYCQRRNRLAKLVEAIAQQRPDIEWPDKTQTKDIVTEPEPKQERAKSKVLETQTGPVHIVWRAQSDKWQLQVTNQGETKLESVFLVLRPSTAVTTTPNRLRIGTLAPGQTMAVGQQLVIRPRASTGDAVCRLDFELVYPAAAGQQRESDYLDIPL
jgi:hypothetical protein